MDTKIKKYLQDIQNKSQEEIFLNLILVFYGGRPAFYNNNVGTDKFVMDSVNFLNKINDVLKLMQDDRNIVLIYKKDNFVDKDIIKNNNKILHKQLGYYLDFTCGNHPDFWDYNKPRYGVHINAINEKSKNDIELVAEACQVDLISKNDLVQSVTAKVQIFNEILNKYGYNIYTKITFDVGLPTRKKYLDDLIKSLNFVISDMDEYINDIWNYNDEYSDGPEDSPKMMALKDEMNKLVTIIKNKKIVVKLKNLQQIHLVNDDK